MDWSGCDLVEAVAGKVFGVPLLVGTRVQVQEIEDGMELGPSAEELAYDYDLELKTVVGVMEYLARHHAAPAR